MEYFTAQGRFWLTQEPRRAVHGSVAFNEDGIRLELADSLRAPVARGGGIVGGSPEWAAEPVVHGRLRDGNEVTLLGLRGLSMPTEGVQETWFADFSLTGGLIGADAFSQMVVIFDYLMPWVQPPGILRSELLSPSVTFETQPAVLAEATLGDGTAVRLVSGVDGQWGDSAVHVDQWCGLEMTGGPKPVIDLLNEWARPLQDLLVVCTGRPVRLEQVLLRAPGHDLRRAPLDLSFKAVQPAARARPTSSHLDNYDAPTLLTYAASPLPFGTLISGWFALSDRLSDAVTLLCGPYYAPFIYSGHRYASTFQSAEALARAAPNSREKTPSQHRERVEAVLAALQERQLDPEIAGWAVRVLQGRNDKPLRQLMAELISSAGEAGRELLAAAPDLPDRLAAARTSVSHPGAGGPGALTRYWLGEALTWVLRVRLLAEVGVPVSDLSASVTRKPSFQEVLSELSSPRPGPGGPSSPHGAWPTTFPATGSPGLPTTERA
jgi:ApeA N-terminal domain 1